MNLPTTVSPSNAVTTPVTSPAPVLEGRHVRLEPLSRRHRDALLGVALDAELWQTTLTRLHTPADLDAFIDAALELEAAGSAIPFATIERSTGRAIGSTRFANIDRGNRRLEIGWSWLGTSFHRRGFNTEAKRLMLEHAFERMDCVRIEFRVNLPNLRSQAAVAGLGARREGVLRHHTIAPDGRLMDWVYYSILREEWPGVRDALDAKLAAHASR